MTTLLVTGANRGLGLEFVRQYAQDPVTILATCRTPEKADALQALAATHKNITIHRLDAADPESMRHLVRQLGKTPLDILINNAGILSGRDGVFTPSVADPSQTLGSLDSKAWEKVLWVNTIAPILVTEACLPLLRQSKAAKIVMISSGWGCITDMDSGYIAYRTSKAALNAAMRNIADTLKQEGITTVSLRPGWVITDMGGPNADLTPQTSIAGMKNVIAGLTVKDTGTFFGYDGKIYPW
jgi:NAD(P)-dependent dehydrogenase (short-subunit alcohol dehydrogenase family)